LHLEEEKKKGVLHRNGSHFFNKKGKEAKNSWGKKKPPGRTSLSRGGREGSIYSRWGREGYFGGAVISLEGRM